MANKQVRRRLAGAFEEHAQFVRDATGSARKRPSVAPPEARAVVRDGARELSDGRVDERPTDRRAAERRIEHHHGTPLAERMQVQAEAANVDQSAGRRHRLSIRRPRCVVGAARPTKNVNRPKASVASREGAARGGGAPRAN